MRENYFVETICRTIDKSNIGIIGLMMFVGWNVIIGYFTRLITKLIIAV